MIILPIHSRFLPKENHIILKDLTLCLRIVWHFHQKEYIALMLIQMKHTAIFTENILIPRKNYSFQIYRKI